MDARQIREVWGKHGRQDRRRYDQSAVQSLVLSRERFRTLAQARAWVKRNGYLEAFRAKVPDVTKESYRFRQRDVAFFRPGTLRTIDLTEGVQAITGRPRR